MHKKGMNFLLVAGALALTALFYGILTAFFKPGPVYQFFCARGWYQPVSAALFFLGIMLAAARWRSLREENASLDMPLPNTAMSRENAGTLASQLPPAYRDTILGRRLGNLLKGYSRAEDLGPLEERLAAADRDELDRGASLLGWVRGLPPLVGLIGTLVGLRGGVADLSMAGNAADPEEIRQRLQLFSSHAGMAFDTTILGVAAALILSAIFFLARGAEEHHITRVDEIAGNLTRQFPSHRDAAEQTANAFLASFLPTMEQAMAAWLAHWQDELTRATGQILEANRSGYEVNKG